MATSGALADFGRMPTSRKVLVFAVIGLFIGLIYYRFVFKSLNERVDEAQASYDGAAQSKTKLEGDIPRYQELRNSMAVLQKKIDENQKALPTEAEVSAFFETLERKVRESGVAILKWTRKNEEPIESFVKVPLEVEITGTFMQIKQFFASLVQKNANPMEDGNEVLERERIVSIEALVLSQPTVRDREIVLSAKFTAVTFRQDDAASAAKPGAPPAAPAAPAPGAAPAGTPPLPSAGTPAGAKVRTEDALDKGGETRVEQSGAGSARLQGGL